MSYKLAGVTWNDDGTMADIKPSPLQALEKITKIHNHDEFKECYIIIETALKNYEEGLENAKTYVKHTSKQALYDLLGLALKNVHKSFWKLPEQLYDDVNISIKALEIIKNKEINIHALLLGLKRFDSPHFYNMLVADKYQMSQEEFDLLKEVLL